MMYRWTLTMACIDRYASSSANAYVREFPKPRIAYRVILIIVIIWIILPVHNFIFRVTNAGVCTWSPAGSAIYNSIFTITFGGIIPPLIMITCAVLIMRNLKHKRERRRNNTQSINAHTADRIVRARDRQILKTLFILS
jgi:bacteriorhodopsin